PTRKKCDPLPPTVSASKPVRVRGRHRQSQEFSSGELNVEAAVSAARRFELQARRLPAQTATSGARVTAILPEKSPASTDSYFWRTGDGDSSGVIASANFSVCRIIVI